MSDVVVTVMVPYHQSFIRYKHQRTERAGLWSEHRVSVRSVEPEAAPVAYRIVPVAGERREDPHAGYSVKNFEGRFWWPLLDANGPVASAEFISLAANGTERVSLTFGCSLGMPDCGKRPTLDDLLVERPKCRLRDSTLDSQLARVNHGATRLAFCDGAVLVAAGQPIYYAIKSYITRDIEISAAPSSLDPAPGAGYRIPGLDLYDRRWSASQGLAFGVDELSRLEALLAGRKKSARVCSPIEKLLKNADEVAPQVCARALAEHLWHVTERENSRYRWLRDYVPCLAKAGDPGASIFSLPHRQTLEEFVAVDWDNVTDALSRQVSDAREILRRLDEIGHATLSKEDADALSSLGI